MKKILITGAAGFIGAALTKRLLEQGNVVIAIDNINIHHNLYLLKKTLTEVLSHEKFTYYQTDVCDKSQILSIFQKEKPETVVHLAGRTGMKASIEEPEGYYMLNVHGTYNILEACRIVGCSNLIHASSVAVYDESLEPVKESRPIKTPSNPYAATKRLSELFTKAYSEVNGINITVLRIFSIFGPDQRTETAVYKFTDLIDRGFPVEVFGDGSARRDYLYLSDCVNGIIRAIDRPFRFEIINLGGQRTITLLEIIELISMYLNKEAQIKFIPAPIGIPNATFADNTKAKKLLGFQPEVSLEEGLRKYVDWYKKDQSKRGVTHE